MLEIAIYIVNPICVGILSQHGLEDCTTKFESNSFRILLSAALNVSAQSALYVKVKSQKAPNSGASKSTALLCICNRLHRKQRCAG